MKYVIGDKVRCIDQEDWAKQLVLDKEYDVLDVSTGGTKINVREGFDRWWVCVSSFELATSPTGWTTL